MNEIHVGCDNRFKEHIYIYIDTNCKYDWLKTLS